LDEGYMVITAACTNGETVIIIIGYYCFCN